MKQLTKKQKRQICKLMLDEIQPINKEFLINEIFSFHPNWNLKKGIGIQEIFIQKNIYGHNAFYIKRIDQTITDISYLRCLYKKNNKYDVILACRNAIKNEIKEYSINNVIFGVTKCSLCNSILIKGETHIDHNNPTFKEIFNNWISNKDVNNLIDLINPSKDLEEETYFIDENIKKDFKSYHNLVCNLRPLCKKCNLSWERISK